MQEVGTTLGTSIEARANQMYGITFAVSDESSWQSEAHTKAMVDARTRVQELAGLAEVELGEMLSVSEVIDGVPTAMMGIKQGMGRGGIAPGELRLRTQIQVTFATR